MDQKVFLEETLEISLSKILDSVKPSRILLVAGQSSYELSGAQNRCAGIFADYEVERFSDFSPNPSQEEIQRGVAVWRKFSPDLVIAIGGGSAIDIAKAVNILAVQISEDILGYVEGNHSMQGEGKPLVAVPVTAGTGSEATHFAVVYVGTKKYSLAHSAMLPTFAVIDASLTESMTPYLTAVTGLDALSQAMEAMWSNKATDESRVYSMQALPIILKNLPGAVHHPTIESRCAMAKGAYLAGKAINIAKTTASHAMSYALTMHFKIPHGHAVALTLPRIFEFNSMVNETDATHPKGSEYTKAIIAEMLKMFGTKTEKEGVEWLETFIASLGIETRLEKLGVSQADINFLVEEMSLERAGNNPRNFTKSEAKIILEKIL